MMSSEASVSSIQSPTHLSVEKISLVNFRNYKELRLVFDQSPVIITGKNGSGKTNLLESISLLVPGKGLRRTELQNLQNNQTSEPWASAIELRHGDNIMTIGTGRDSDHPNHERRLIQIDGKNIKNQNTLAEYVAMAWITPDMDRLLAEGSSTRRKFLDRLCCSFDPAHKGRLTRYEKAMRERLRLLREGMFDKSWLAALEDEMAMTGVAIAATRRQMMRQLRSAINQTDSIFPRAHLDLKGLAEESLETQPALLVEDLLRSNYALSRSEDSQSGTCSIGPHRSDLITIHQAKNCPADLCSTGEQKALLLAIILAFMRIIINSRNIIPLFLLDDIAAHLDDIRRDALFDEIKSLKCQTWLTGTDLEPFISFLPFAQHYKVEENSWIKA